MPRRRAVVVFSHAEYRRAHNRTPGGKGNWTFSIRPGAVESAALDEAVAALASKAKHVEVDRATHPNEVRLRACPSMWREEAERYIDRVLSKAAQARAAAERPKSQPLVIPAEICP